MQPKFVLASLQMHYQTSSPSHKLYSFHLACAEDTGYAYLDEDVIGAQLLAICHPLCFLQGELCKPPAVEDLHVSLIEDTPSDRVQKVLQLLPRRPPAKQLQQQQQKQESPAASASTSSSTSSSSSSSSSSGAEDVVSSMAATATTTTSSSSSSSSEPSSSEPSSSSSSRSETSTSSSREAAKQVVVGWEKLDPRSYQPEQLVEVNALGSGPLMRTLQRSSWSEEYQDAASSQVGLACNPSYSL